MTEARRLLKLFEAESSDYDKQIGRALGVQMPDDWEDERSVFNDIEHVARSHQQPSTPGVFDQGLIAQLEQAKFWVSIHYEAITWPEEDDGNGPDEERGTIEDNTDMDWETLIDTIRDNGYSESSVSPITPKNAAHSWLRTVEPDEDFETGTKTYYSLHVNRVFLPNGAHNDAEFGHEPNSTEMYLIYKMAGLPTK